MASQKLTNLRSKRAEIKKELLEESKKVFEEESRALFDKYPELSFFRWTQYTPYFNDGDTCEFSAHTEWPAVVLVGGEDEYVDDPFLDGLVGESEKGEEIEEAVKKFLAQIDEEEYKEMFGDHVEIIVKKSGIEIEEYDHD